MKRLFIFLLLSVATFTSLKAQWQRTGSLLGGNGVAISALAGNDSAIFAGGGDGIFISTNDGTTWTSSNTGLTNHFIESLGINGNSIFAGIQGGISRSTNNGATWQTVFNLTTGYIKSFASMGSKIFAINIVDVDSIYLSTDNGISWHSRSSNVIRAFKLAVMDTIIFAGGFMDVNKSTDDGLSWVPTNLNRGIWSLAVKDTNIFAGCDDGIYIYSNFGNNWTECTINFLTTYPNVTALGISSSGDIIAYSTEGFFKSTDNGVSWNLLNNDITDNFFTTIIAHGSNLFAGGEGVYRSTDDGINWTAKISGMLPIITSLAVRNSVLTAGSNTGRIFYSLDSGDSWVPADTGFYGQYVRSLIVGGTKLYAGTGQGVFVASNFYGTDWQTLNNGLTNTHVLSLAYDSVGIGNTNFFAGTYGSGVFISTNNGNNWTAANSGIDSSIVWSLTISDNYIYAACGFEGVFITSNSGTGWSEANEGLTDADVRSLAQCDSFIFAGTWGTGIFRSSQNDLSWTPVNSGLVDLYILSLYTIDSNIFAATYNGVFLSTDFGLNWVSVNSGLENMDAWTFNVLGSYVYAGTSTGDVMKRPLSEILTAVQNQLNTTPTEFLLSQNYPNPFNPSTTIKYSIPQSSDVVIKVFDILGNAIETLVNEEKPAGTYHIIWYAANLPSGVYFYQLKADEFIQTRKMLLLK